MNEGPLALKMKQLRELLKGLGSVVVAYSGGVDSGLLLKVATEELGERCIGMLAVSASLPEVERQAALEFANQIGAVVKSVTTLETEDEAYQANAPNRCLHCKDKVYAKLLEEAGQFREGSVLLDGMNADDTLDMRPGRAAAMKHGVRSPLHELGLTKSEVREAAKMMGLSIWDKPAAACLASRIPYGTRVTDDLLKRVENAEGFVRSLGFEELRVRHQGEIARIEVPVKEFERAVLKAGELVGGLKALGWLYVTLDLEGIRQGSMNAPLFQNA
jgi:pyridinium-3,5-biscarboxylic acid mononucleotide sulfurtransferase